MKARYYPVEVGWPKLRLSDSATVALCKFDLGFGDYFEADLEVGEVIDRADFYPQVFPAQGLAEVEGDRLVSFSKNPQAKWTYPAKLLGVYDGDTITVRLDRGLGFFSDRKIRLAGIDTPERRGKERDAGIAVRNRLVARLGVNPELTIETFGLDKYGRCLGMVFLHEGDCILNINYWLVREGLAEAYGV